MKKLLNMDVIPTNFVKDDAGRSKSKRPLQKGDCSVKALSIITGVPYDSAYEFCKDHGRGSHQGFNLDDILKKHAKNGTKFYNCRIIRHSFQSIKGQERMYRGAFCVLHPKGKYIVTEAGHLTAVIDGKNHDESWDCFRCVYTAYEFVPWHRYINPEAHELSQEDLQASVEYFDKLAAESREWSVDTIRQIMPTMSDSLRKQWSDFLCKSNLTTKEVTTLAYLVGEVAREISEID